MIRPTLDEKLRDIIAEIIYHYEYDHDHELSAADQAFLIRTLSSSIPRSIEKFILGGKEHNSDGDNDFVTSVQHLEELQKEIHDSQFYIAAAIECSRAKKQ